MNYTDFIKSAAIGLKKQKDVNLTDLFLAEQERRQRAAGAGAMGGAVGYTLSSLLDKGIEKPKGSGEKLPEFDHESEAYIGQAYEVPEDEEALQALHKKLIGQPWEPSAPSWLE